MKIAIVGCGAMGSIYAGLMADAGNEVWAIDTWKDHVDAINRDGLRVEGASGDRRVTSIRATTDGAEVGVCDLVIVATKASGVAAAARTALGLTGPDTVILTIQNGLGAADRIAEAIPTSQVMLGVVGGFGASMRGPAHAHHNGMELVRLGEMDGGETVRLAEVVKVWEGSGFAARGFPDIHQMIWEKLICNCAFSGPCGVTGLTVGQVLDHPDAWKIASSCAAEADTVARTKGIRLGFEDVEDYVRSFGSKIRGAKPSLLQDQEARRPSEIDAINGAIPVEAAKVGLAAPINATVAGIIRARESGF
ncbi:2-dehydropantoate 2-reductase [Thalassobaculum sp.]|uniref:ketopantoate reductase family protein n=1 Tax=Thalassobaculum sp. TaxID=2022740 RepID=UPI0032EB2CD3